MSCNFQKQLFFQHKTICTLQHKLSIELLLISIITISIIKKHITQGELQDKYRAR
jgi:hypothetical protein